MKMILVTIYISLKKKQASNTLKKKFLIKDE